VTNDTSTDSMSAPDDLDCDAVAERLWDFVDGELPPREMAAVDAHLEDCERCFPVYRFRQAFRDFLSCQEKAEIPVGLRRAVFERVLEEHQRVEAAGPDSVWERLKRGMRRRSD